jgi:hypothetical protein
MEMNTTASLNATQIDEKNKKCGQLIQIAHSMGCYPDDNCWLTP